MDDLETFIIEAIDDNGLKGTELACKFQIWACENNRTYDVEDLFKKCEKLVKNKEIIEIEYVLPHMNYRTKSFYLPKGSIVNVFNNIEDNGDFMVA